MRPPVGVDHTETGSLGPAIYSKNSHSDPGVERTACPAILSSGQSFYFRFVDFVIAVDVLHVVVFFERFV